MVRADFNLVREAYEDYKLPSSGSIISFARTVDASYELFTKFKKPLPKHLFEQQMGFFHQRGANADTGLPYFALRQLIESRCPTTYNPDKVFTIQSNVSKLQLVGKQIFSQHEKHKGIFVYVPKLHNQKPKDTKKSKDTNDKMLEFQGILTISSDAKGKRAWKTFNVWEDNAMTMGQMPTIIGLTKCGFYMDFIGIDNQKLIEKVHLHHAISYVNIYACEEQSMLILGAKKASLAKDVLADFLIFNYPPLECISHLQIMKSAFANGARFEVNDQFGMIYEGKKLSISFLLDHIIKFASPFKDEDMKPGFKITHRLETRPLILFTIQTPEFELEIDEYLSMVFCISKLIPGEFKLWTINPEPLGVQNGVISSNGENFTDTETDSLAFTSGSGFLRMIHLTTKDINIFKITRDEDENGIRSEPKVIKEFIIDFKTQLAETPLAPNPNQRTSGRTKKKVYQIEESLMSYSYNPGLDFLAAARATSSDFHLIIYNSSDWRIVKEFKSPMAALGIKSEKFLNIKEFSFNCDHIVLQLQSDNSRTDFIFINLLTESND